MGDAQPVQLITNEQGLFRYSSLEAGSYRATISFIGYSTTIRDSLYVGDNDTISIEVALVPQAIDMGIMIVSTSRRPEQIGKAPSAAVVVGASDIQPTIALTNTDHLERLPAVDASSTGMNSSNVVVRGFNNVLSTTVLSLVDNRIIQIPSLRVNAYQFSTTVDEDIERIELVLGPGSALYGPNASDGVMHVITQSPFASAGGVLSLTGGERDLGSASLRWAGTDGRKLGFRISGKYFRGFDWQVYDSEEDDTQPLFRQGPTGNQYDSSQVVGSRDFKVETFSGDVRGDMLISDDGVLTLGAGLSQASNIELTDLGAAQIKDWRFGYVQLRTNYKNLFAQAYINFSDAGGSYLRRSGALIIDRSRLYVGQIQHAAHPWRVLRLTYGLDALLTRPETDYTLHGTNEDRDNLDAIGAYAQADVSISSRLKAMAAARLDRDNVIEDPVFSPRLALVYNVAKQQTLRLSYNRAFSTPSTADFFLDVLAGTAEIPDTSVIWLYMGGTLANFRGGGSVDGFRFHFGDDRRPQMVSLYGDSLVALDDEITDPNAYLEPDVNSVWPAMRQMLIGINPPWDFVLPGSLSTKVPGTFARMIVVDDSTLKYESVPKNSIQNVTPLEQTTTNSIEFGYKGRIGKRLAASADVYYTQKENFVGPLQNESPHVMIDRDTFIVVLGEAIRDSTGDSVSAYNLAESIYDQIGQLPIGLVSPVEYQNAIDVLSTRRNFGMVDLFGVDLAATFHLNPNWNITGTYSYISQDLFRKVDGIRDVATNAPRHKVSGALSFLSRGRALRSQLHLRWIDGFPVQSGVYVGQVERYVEVNLNLSYRFLKHTEVYLTVQNLFDNRHAEFVGAPELGRLAMVRLSQRW
jgi:iron complex outermembrane receptor protein